MLVHERVPQNYWLPPASPGGRLRVDLFGAEELIAADWKPGSTPRGVELVSVDSVGNSA